MNMQRLFLYSSYWQGLRVGMLAEHSTVGGWTTVTGTEQNLEKCWRYIDQRDITAEQYYLRLWRVLNALNAVRMGYSGQGKANSAPDKLVLEARLELSDTYQQYKDLIGPMTLHSCGYASLGAFQDETTKELRALVLTVRHRILDNLQHRQQLHNDRTELNWYITKVLIHAAD